MKIPKGCTWPADLCKFAAHCHQKSPTWRHRVPKCAPMLTFGSSEGHFSKEIRDSGPLPEPWYLLRFRHIQQVVAGLFGAWRRPKQILKTLCQLFSLLMPSGFKKHAQCDTRAPQRRPKLPKVMPGGTQNALKKSRWGFAGCPRSP